ncbi:MAG: response regulator [Rhizobacter sp.]|nr:response regulator [Rhizobacter sp.]
MTDMAAAVLPGVASRRLSVLLLEDSAFDAELLQEWLKRSYADIRITWTDDEPSFVDALGRYHFDIILSDYQLPTYTGIQALDLVRRDHPRVPFIFVSGVIGEDNAVDMLKRGATDYVIKNRLSRLPVAIDRALEEVRQRDAREAVEAQLRDADALYARVVDSLRNHAVILLDGAGIIRSWNLAAQAIFGHTRDDTLGRSIELIFTAEDRETGRWRDELALAFARGDAPQDRWLLHADGTPLRGEGVLTPLYNAAGDHTGFSMLVRDATAAFRDAAALREAKEEAERANRAKDRFLAVLSHELRTPLAPIATAAQVLERNAVVPERMQHLLPMIRRNVALEARLIDDLLDLTAIGAGKITLRLQSVDVHKLVAAVAEMLAADVERGALALTLHLEAARSTVHGDEARIQQVIWNIVRNAVKFTPAGGRVEVRTHARDGVLELTCTDSGIGIHADALPRIFTAFEQADADVAQRFGGLGLGLAIAHGLLLRHGGTLQARSEGRDRGATFVVQLPLSETQPGMPSTEDELAASRAPASVHLLLVEDNHDAADALGLSMHELGYRVTHASSCRQALALARQERFDAVVTDLGLPDGSGIEIGRQLHGQLPVIALSGYGTQGDLRKSADAGFVAHLVKPVSPAAVHAAVQSALAESAP